jgi:phosphoenolpyruvate carboxylase
MSPFSAAALQQFRTQVGIKFQLYNSLFTSLPFHRIEKTGILLPLLLSDCEEGYRRRLGPLGIIDGFFDRHTSFATEPERIDVMFRFVQYVERQVVLFDALEDAAFRDVNDMSGTGTLKHLEAEVSRLGLAPALAERLREFCVRLVLTAHPTQFYPGSVLGIIHDLSKAVGANDLPRIETYLQQLGKTPFFKKRKPTPYDEAVSLIWYLENVFYPACGRIADAMKGAFGDALPVDRPLVSLGFWPGGDRDGNPFVTAETTLRVADALRGSAIKCYYQDLRRLRRRLTFEGVEEPLQELEKKLYDNIFIPGMRTGLTSREILDTLSGIRQTLLFQHNGLFVGMVDRLITRVELFGLHFASLDIRQEASVHRSVLSALVSVLPPAMSGYAAMEEGERMAALAQIREPLSSGWQGEAIVRETFESMAAVRRIQESNGHLGCERYIISQCGGACDVMEVLALFVLSGWRRDHVSVDIVPLFETIGDLTKAEGVMRTLYSDPVYASHLKRRGNRQTIMLGFSDGTKDGGYLMANYSIYRAKESLTRISREHGVEVVFFDGRGGPPARGGGKTHRFYASMGREVANHEIQLTIQGQTISSNFGTVDAAQFNIEQLMHAGLGNDLASENAPTMADRDLALFGELAQVAHDEYLSLRGDPGFMDYLVHASPLRFYAETNIGSRPAKRGSSARMGLKDLRAIPFVGAWSQLKQNVTGYYGVGAALRRLDEAGRFEEVRDFYQRSAFFRTLIDNCEMAMLKCFFPLTEFLRSHPVHGPLWERIHEEYVLTQRYVCQLSGKGGLMEDFPVERLSIQMRERIVLPLTTIQQYAITKVREMEERNLSSPLKRVYEKLAMRCSFGIINAGRNSA